MSLPPVLHRPATTPTPRNANAPSITPPPPPNAPFDNTTSQRPKNTGPPPSPPPKALRHVSRQCPLRQHHRHRRIPVPLLAAQKALHQRLADSSAPLPRPRVVRVGVVTDTEREAESGGGASSATVAAGAARRPRGGTPAGAGMIDGLEVREEDYKLLKNRFSSFLETNLHSLLQSAGIDSIVVVGIQTPNCIRQTVFDAVSLDYPYVTVIVDATAAETPEVHDGIDFKIPHDLFLFTC
ncbi:hypothetical protein Syun_025975 [Stephania yunnanensis]|uniref:Isochorismatase-like domain-containing protein n=1 Tax=Stephania yunnanensis TaxID=152371 RepID=A0AAP0EVB2_9MAGN